MKARLTRTIGLSLVMLGLSGQEGPNIFQLWVPDFFDAPLSGKNAVVELPDRPLRRLRILVRGAQERNLNPGRYRVFVNGKGLGNVFEERTVLEGTMLVMEPETLRKRPDELFDPRENAIEITAEDRRGRRYYQNWILRTHDSSRNSMFGYVSTVSPDDPQGTPPDIILAEPASPIILRPGQPSTKVTLRGQLSRGASLFIGGRMASPAGASAINKFELAETVSAPAKELILEAKDDRGNSRKVIIPIHIPGSPVKAPRFGGQKYAILVGVSRFGSGKQAPPSLPAAAAEVREIGRQLESGAGFKPENIRILTDDKATLESVRIAFGDFAAKAQSNDLLFIYIATHGVHDPRPNRVDQLFLTLHGTQMPLMDSTALSFPDLEMLLNRSVRTSNCFLVFDVGHELNDEWRFRAGRNLVNNHVLNLFSDKQGWSVLVSGSSDEISVKGGAKGSEDPPLLFPATLAKALSGPADLNRDGVITARELFSFVVEGVKTESGGKQTPRFRAGIQSGDQPLTGK